jgi:hypothetical protein
MLFSHRFGSVETLSRARYWMDRLGFEIAPVDDDSHDVSRLSLNIDFSRTSAAMALIDSIEASDPNGWPGFMTPSRKLEGAHELLLSQSDNESPSPARSPIHWHHRDEESATNPDASKVAEYMLSRWE